MQSDAQTNVRFHPAIRVNQVQVETYCRDVQRYVTYRLARFLNKPNRDGSFYAPFNRGLYLSAPRGIPTFLTVVYDAERLWHFQPDRLIERNFVAALSGDLRRPVIAFQHTQEPSGGDPIPTGICFMVVLRDLPKVAQIAAPALPRVAKLDLTRNGDYKNKLLEPIGVGVNGAVWKHLRNVEHVLYVGVTGSGKTTAMHCSLAALLTQNDPELIRVALIDTSQSEFVFWHRAPHVWGKVAYTLGDALILLKQLEVEVQRRGGLLGTAMRRSIESYNADALKKMPYLLVVVDECLDLVQGGRGGGVINELLKRVATGGRKAGVYLRAGTQYPSAAEGLSRVISTNLRTIAFRLDDVGARTVRCPAASAISESTPGRMYARFDDSFIELQGFFLSDDELTDIARRSGFVAINTAANDVSEASQDETTKLIGWAIGKNGGVLTTSDIGAMLGQWRGTACGPREARRIAERLESEGLLAKEAKQNNRRCVTDAARVRYSLSPATNATNVSNAEENSDGAGGLSKDEARQTIAEILNTGKTVTDPRAIEELAGRAEAAVGVLSV